MNWTDIILLDFLRKYVHTRNPLVFKLILGIHNTTLKLTHNSSRPQWPSDSLRPRLRLLLSGDVHPNPCHSTKVYMSGVCSQGHKLWGGGGVFLQLLFWLGTYEVFCSSKRSGVPTNYERGMQLLQFPTHSTDTTTTSTINSNTSCRCESLHHHAIHYKWHRQQTDRIMLILRAT